MDSASLSGCGCANRERAWLRELGYKREGDEWVHEDGHRVADADVRDHHFREAVSLLGNHRQAAAVTLLRTLIRWDHGEEEAWA